MTALSSGDPAPDFTLENQDGEAIRLADYRGRRVVLYFYPKDDTSGCTAQARGIRDRIAEFDARDAVVLGVSPDSVASHRKFADKYDLPFPLLADVGHTVADAYGVWKEKKLYGRKYRGNERTTFVIGADGRIEHILPRVTPATHAGQLLDLV
ncbi:MAG: thioredoxin-dependent thiol peroxidase [Gemmatimonadetes bacterium]|nr:thioredoxin-dependent thiol peroxidase [Gemmatimonadota bacterium]